MLIKSGPDYCLTATKATKTKDAKNNKLSLYNLSSTLAKVVRERKRDNVSAFQVIYQKQI